MTMYRKYYTSQDPAGTGGPHARPRGVQGEAPRPIVADSNAEEEYWREHYATRTYARDDRPFLEYKPAYRYGADAHTRHPDRSFDEVESDLRQDWDRFKGTSSLTWDEARHAARDAWQRVKDAAERALPGDRDRDGK